MSNVIPVVEFDNERETGNWFSLELSPIDNTLQLESLDYRGSEGLVFKIYKPFINAESVKINNYSLFALTDRIRSEDTFTYKTPNTTSNNQFISYIAANHYTDTEPPVGSTLCRYRFMKSINSSDPYLSREKYKLETVTIGYPDKSAEAHDLQDFKYTTKEFFFNFRIIDADTLQIFHNDGVDMLKLHFVFKSGSNAKARVLETNNVIDNMAGIPAGLEFAPADESLSHFTSLYGTDITIIDTFEYVIDPKTQSLMLMLMIDDMNYMIRYSTSRYRLIVEDFTSMTSISNSNVFKLSYDSNLDVTSVTDKLNSPLMNGMSTDWYSYKPTTDQNNLDIENCNCFTELKNNYLFNVEFYNSYIDSTGSVVGYNFTPLKNQLTPSGVQHRASIINKNLPVNIRRYTGIHTGTNQQRGTDKVYLSYDTNIDLITFKPGRVTYFHTPQDMYPYEYININDLELHSKGSYGGDSPLTSDKIFKKKAGYKTNTPHGEPTDEHSWTWLCTWLYTDPKTGDSTWLDRYYKTSSLGFYDALRRSVNPSVIYVSHHESISDHVSAEAELFDKVSDLRLQPGSWYAYYRLGVKDFFNIYNTIPGKKLATIDSLTTGNATVVSDTDTYELDGDTTGSIPIYNNPQNDENFSITFTLTCDDWTKPIGSQLIGNYCMDGVGVFNVVNSSLINIFHQVFEPTKDFGFGWGLSYDYIHVYNHNLTKLNRFKLDKLGSAYVIPYVSQLTTFDTIYVIMIKTNFTGDKRYDWVTGDRRKYRGSADVEMYWIREYDLHGTVIREKEIDVSQEPALLNYRKENPNQPDRNQRHYTSSQLVVDVDTITLPYNYTGNLALQISTVDFSSELIKIPDMEGHSAFRKHVYGSDDNVTDTIVKTPSGLRFMRTGRPGDEASRSVYNHVYNLNDQHDNLISATCRDGYIYTFKNLNLLNKYRLDGNYYDDETKDPWRYFGLLGFASIDGEDLFLYWGTNGVTKYVYLQKGGTTQKLDFLVTTGKDPAMDLLRLPSGEYNIIIREPVKYSKSTPVRWFVYDESLQLIKTEYITSDRAGFAPYRSRSINNCISTSLLPQSLNFKTRLVNSKNIVDIKNTQLSVDVSKFSPGAKHFIYTCDTVNGAVTLYVNGELYNQVRIKPGLYRTGTPYNKELTIGKSVYIHNTDLSEYIKMDKKHTTIDNCTISNVKTFNVSLSYYEARAVYLHTTPLRDMQVELPTGYKNYIDGVDMMFKHRLPGGKSTQFDVNFYTLTVSDANLLKELTTSVDRVIRSMIPLNTSPRDYTWSKDLPSADASLPSLDINKFRIYQQCLTDPSPTPTPTPSVTPTITPTVTPSITITPSVTPSITITPSVTPSITITPSVTPTITPSISITPSVTVTPTITVTPSSSPPSTPSVTPTVTPSVTATPSVTTTATPSITPTPDASQTPTPTVTPTVTPSITITPSVTPSITITPSVTPSPSLPQQSDCCDDYDTSITTTGDINNPTPVTGGVSASLFEVGGRLCFNKLTETGQPGRVNVKTDDDTIQGILNTTGTWIDPEIVYVTADGETCWKGNVNVKDATGIWTILTKI